MNIRTLALVAVTAAHADKHADAVGVMGATWNSSTTAAA